jgi:DNA-binding transcriptional MerR regulator
MRWTEIQAFADAREDLTVPTYRQLDIWTRNGLLKSESRGDNHGRYRWWDDTELAVAFTVARLVSVGFSVNLAFQLARTKPDAEGVRTLFLDGADKPLITVSVGA